VEKYLIGLLLLYTSQNLLGTIFRVTFTVFYRRIWNIVGKYSILCWDTQKSGAAAGDSKAVEYIVIRIEEVPQNHSEISCIFSQEKGG
jgi:hypothetical protein